MCPGKEIAMPIDLLRDAAYPLKTWLLKPYTDRANLTAAQRGFNYRLNRAHMTIESKHIWALEGQMAMSSIDTRCVCRFCQYSCNSMCYHP